MKVDTMRRIDQVAGVPLTFLLSIPLWIIDLFRKPSQPDRRRTLFIELSEMGSAILVDPAMRKLKAQSDTELFFVIFQRNVKSLYLLDTIPRDNIFTMRATNLFLLAWDTLRFIAWCRQKRITCIIDLELFSRFTALLSGLSLAGSRIGFGTLHDEGNYRGRIVNFPVRYNPHVHISVNFIALVNTALGFHYQPYPTHPVEEDELKLAQAEVTETEQEGVRDKIRELFPDWKGERLVLINANASDLLPQRRWLPEYFVAVSRFLLEQFEDILLVATGAPAEREYVGRIVEEVNDRRFINSAGVFQFEELVPLYSISTLMLTNDSGPAHFSSVTPLKVFVLFGPETPKLYGPLGNAESFYLGLPCSPCVSATNHRKTTCTTRPCITGISPIWVQERLAAYLQKSPVEAREESVS
jgi:ADP-heptose:LPS heptosyltransferase